ncbi:MAG: glycosyltransferase family 39 protein [Gemmatimonadota bacterium]
MPGRGAFCGRHEGALGVAIVAVGAILRAWGLTAQSLTSDELYEIDMAAGPLSKIVTAADGFPPLYNLLLHGWLGAWGGAESARWLSWLLGVASILVVWRLGRRLGGVTIGLGTAAFVAISPVHIWYSQEARAYMLVILLASLAIWLLFRALDGDVRRDWAMYAAAGAAGMYAHYYFLFVLLPGALVILLHRGLGKGLARPAAAHAAIAAACVPLVFLLRADFQLQADYANIVAFDVGALGYTFVSILTGYSIGPSLRELHTFGLVEALRGFLPWLAALLPAVAILAYRGAAVLGRERARDLALFIALPVVLVGLLGTVAHVGYNVRYVIWIAIPMAVWLGAVATCWRRAPVAVALAIVLGMSGLGTWNRRTEERYRNEDARAAAAWLRSHADDDAPVFTLAAYMSRPIAYYVGRDREVQPIPRGPREERIETALGTLESRVRGGDSYWLAYTRAFHGDRDGAVRAALERRHGLEPVARFAGIVLYRGSVPARGSASPARPAAQSSAR